MLKEAYIKEKQALAQWLINLLPLPKKMLSWGKSHPEICSPREGKSPKCIRLCSFTTPTYGLHNVCMTAVINDSPLAHFTSLFINICQVSQLFVEKKSVSCFCSLCYMTVFLLFSTTGVTPVRKQWHILSLVSVLQHHPCDIIIMGTYFLGLNQLNKMFLKDCMDQSQLLFSWDMGHLQSGSWLKPPSIRLQTEKSLSADRFHSEEISKDAFSVLFFC